ncbi:MAG: hypothetical protein ACOVOA_13730, partial [Allorhizobium sp.]
MSFISAQTSIDFNSEGTMPSWNVLAQSLYSNPKMVSVAHWFARVFIAEQPHRARSSSIFTTQQRWLLAHLAASLYCLEATGRGGRLSLQTYVKAAVEHRVASRNTARHQKEVCCCWWQWWQRDASGRRVRDIGGGDVQPSHQSAGWRDG